MPMKVNMQNSEFQLIEVESNEPGAPYVKIEDEKIYGALKANSQRSGIPMGELATSMIEFAICNLVIIDKNGKRIV